MQQPIRLAKGVQRRYRTLQEPLVALAEELDEIAAEALREIDGASEAARLADAVDAEIAAGVAGADPTE